MAVEKEALLQQLYDAYNEDPQSLSAHLALTSALKSDPSKKDQLKNARFQFSQRSALPAKVWREWIVDEIRAQGKNKGSDEEENDDEDDSMSKESNSFVVTLCTLALSDFQDIGVWLTYLEVTTGVSPNNDDDSDDEDEDDDDEEDVADTREYFEESLRAFGMHFSQGFKLWKMYLNFEMQRYRKLIKKGVNKAEASESIIKLFNRQLSLPLKDNNSTMHSASKFLMGVYDNDTIMVEKVMSPLKQTHETASKLRLKCEPYEVAIASASGFLNPKNNAAASLNGTSSSLDADGSQEKAYHTLISKWFDYIACLTKLQEVPLVLCAYERACAQLSKQHRVWDAYLAFTSTHLKDPKLSMEVARRATRNIPQHSDFHCQYLRLLEKNSLSSSSNTQSDVLEAVQFALNCKLGDVSSFFDVILSYCDYCRRRVSSLFCDEASDIQDIVAAVVSLRESFENGLVCLEQYGEQNHGDMKVGNSTGGKIQSITQQRSLNKCRLKLFMYYVHTEENLVSSIINDQSTSYQTIVQIFERCVNSLGQSDCSPWISYAEFETRQKRKDEIDVERSIFERAFDTFRECMEGDSSGEQKQKKKNLKVQKENQKVKLIELLKLCEVWLMFERERGSLQSFEETMTLIQQTKDQVRQMKKAEIDVDGGQFEVNNEEPIGGGTTEGKNDALVRKKTSNDLKRNAKLTESSAKRKNKSTEEEEKEEEDNGRQPFKQKRSVGVIGQYGHEGQPNEAEGQEPLLKKAKSEPIKKSTSSYKPMLFHKSGGVVDNEGNSENGVEEDLASESSQEVMSPEEQEHVSKTLFVTNLSFQVSKEELEGMFKQGSVSDSALLLNKAGRFRGMATVTFTSAETAQEELARLGNNFMHDGRMISLSQSTKKHLSKRREGSGKVPQASVTMDDASMMDDSPTKKQDKVSSSSPPLIPYHAETIFVKGLKDSCGAAELIEAFSQYGSVLEARVLKDRFTKKSKCEALVQFTSADSVNALLSTFSSLSGSSFHSLGNVSIEKSRFPALLKSKAPPKNAIKKHNPYMSAGVSGSKKQATSRSAMKAKTPTASSAASSSSSAATTATISSGVAKSEIKKSGSVFSFIPRTLRK